MAGCRSLDLGPIRTVRFVPSGATVDPVCHPEPVARRPVLINLFDQGFAYAGDQPNAIRSHGQELLRRVNSSFDNYECYPITETTLCKTQVGRRFCWWSTPRHHVVHAIRAALINPFGISPTRIEAVGLGEEQLLNRRNPEAAENRRVQLINIGK